MNTETMNVHKALAELKVLDSRIINEIHTTSFVVANKHANQKISGVDIADFKANMKSGYDSVCDLIARREALKRAVVLSNAVTKVTIAGKEYTVAEAIEMKNHGVEVKRALLSNMKTSYMGAKQECDRNNGDALEERANKHISTMFDKSDMKDGACEEAKKARAEFITSQTYELVDPLDIKSKIEALEKEINDFYVEVDSALSVSNALTVITFSYGA